MESRAGDSRKTREEAAATAQAVDCGGRAGRDEEGQKKANLTLRDAKSTGLNRLLLLGRKMSRMASGYWWEAGPIRWRCNRTAGLGRRYISL